MARVKLGLSYEEFWYDTTPRKMYVMIDEWRKIMIGESKLERYILDGGEIETEEDNKTQEADARFL